VQARAVHTVPAVRAILNWYEIGRPINWYEIPRFIKFFFQKNLKTLKVQFEIFKIFLCVVKFMKYSILIHTLIVIFEL